MEKNRKRFLSILLALVMVIGLMPMNALAAEGDVQADLSVTARYMTNRLTWDADGVTYDVERSEDGQAWARIGTSAAGTWLDENAGLGTRYYYRLTDGDASTAGVQGETTGMEALKKIAVLFYEGNDSTAFDGSNKEVIATGEKAAELNALESGTIVYKATMTNVTNKQGVLGTNNDCYVGAYASKFRHELGGLNGEINYQGMVVGANTAGFVYDDSDGHWALCANGGGVTSVDLNEANFGMLTAVNASTYYAGGSPAYPLNGTVNYILILSEILTDAELKTLTGANLDHDEVAVQPLGANIGMMMDDSGAANNSNSWMFDGGRTTSGSFTEIGGIRNYVYQFEEYVRGKKMGNISAGWNSRQRYTINVGRDGQSLADSLAAFDRRAAELDPRAAVYLVGAEDYMEGADGIEAFKADLDAYIRKAVKLRDGSGFAMIQTPYPNASTENDELYAAAVREVLDALTGGIRGNVVLVDHNAVALSADCYNADGSLSGKGHYELGRQLSAAVCGDSSGYQTLTSLTPVAAPGSYSDEAPVVTSEGSTLVISGLEELDWTVEIALQSYTLTTEARGPVITVEDLPAEDYILTVTASDMSVRLPVIAGTVGSGEGALYAPVLDANQQAIADLVDGDEPLTWLFMGDSITHGAVHTYGYDSISQLFEKFLKDDLGREDDIVINTAVSSADTNDTISELHARLNRYQPDVVSIMIGTNDSAAHINVSETNYKANLRTIIAAIEAKGAKVILRTPVPTKDGSRTNIGDYANWMGEVAEEYADVILVEQYDSMAELFAAAPYTKSVLFNSGDYLHPTTEGQTWMLHRFLEETGLMRDGYLANLWYDTASRTVSEIEPPVDFANGTATLDTAALASAYGRSLYLVRLMATDGMGNVYSTDGKAGDVLTMENLPGNVFFTAEAKLADSNAWVTFGVPRTVEVEVYVGRTQTVGIDGEVIPNAEGVKGLAEVTYATKVMGKAALDNTFSAGYTALADCEYTFDRQSDGTYLIHADVDGTTVYIDPHAGAGNTGYPNRTYQSRITLEPVSDGAFKLHQMNEGYLHFWDNDDTKLYWDQCTGDGGHTGHNLFIYRHAGADEQASAEVPGYVKVTSADAITSGGKYLVVAKANSGGYYALKPCKTTSNKYEHICKIGGIVTELTIKGIAVGNGTITAGNNIINVQVLSPESTVITLNYNYDGAPANGRVTVVTGDPVGELPVPMRPGYTFFGWYLGGTKVTSSYVVTEPVTLTADWVTVTTKEKPADGVTTNGQPFPERFENGSAYCYRIPGIVTLADGTVVAMADARWNTWADCGGLDTIISASRDNGKTWNYTYANYLGDNGDIYNPWSTTFIDPAIATDGETVYMIADLFPAGVSTMANGYASQAGSGGFHPNGKLMLRDLVGDTYKHGDGNQKSAYLSMATSRSYDFYLDPNADGSYTIRRVSDDSAVSGYSVDAMLNIRSTDGSVDTHLFMADSPYQVYPTNYLYLTKSVDGLNWSAPELIVAKNASESAYLIGPGSGTYDAVHGNMIFTAYSYSGSASSQKTSLLWAGADGVWHRSENATTDVWSSEASAVVLDDGTVRVFYRSGSNILCYTDYLWDGDEYVRDEANTSVSTEAVKNSGNGCMLTAVKYPEKVNGREMILVATPATSGSRSDGHIYAFYANKDGTMELVADFDITPGSAEYYAYSCLTVLTTGEEAGDLALFWEDSWTNSPATATIRYSVIPMADVLAGVKEAVWKDVALKVGETVTFEDPDGYYVGADTSELDTGVATVSITGTVTETVTAAGDAVSTIADGTYILVNTRAGKPLTNGTASADGGNGLSLNGTKNNVAAGGVWTVKAVSGGYTVQDAEGRYLTIGSNTAGMTTAESVVSIARNGSNWTISQSNAYLNDFGGKGICAAGWQNASAQGDAGSQWQIHTVEEVAAAGTSRITFTGMGAGQTQVLIGNTIYSITVTEPAPANPFVDVAEDAYYYEPVQWAVSRGITSGTSDTTFSPDDNCTRAQAVTFLWAASGCPEPETAENPFVDVVPTDYFYKAVLWAAENGITSGVDTTHFDPNAACTRAQVVTFLYNAFDGPSVEGVENPFSDVPADAWYAAPILWAVQNGITSGVGGGLFGVNQTCTRAQIVTFLYIAYN